MNKIKPVLLIVANNIIAVATIKKRLCIKVNFLLSNKNVKTATNATDALLGSLKVLVKRKIARVSATSITLPLIVQNDLVTKYRLGFII